MAGRKTRIVSQHSTLTTAFSTLRSLRVTELMRWGTPMKAHVLRAAACTRSATMQPTMKIASAPSMWQRLPELLNDALPTHRKIPAAPEHVTRQRGARGTREQEATGQAEDP